MYKTGRAALLSLVVGFVGCNKEQDSIDAEEFSDAWSTRVCESVIDCGCEYPNGARIEHCLSLTSVDEKAMARQMMASGLTFDRACAHEELDKLESMGCSVPLDDSDGLCESPCKLWVGPMQAGSTCRTISGFDNCAQGLVCSDEVCTQPCAESTLPAIDEACSPASGCAEGLYCDTTSAPLLPVCASFPSLGKPCLVTESGGVCAEGFVCDSTDLIPTCVSLPRLGEECLAGGCGDGLRCDHRESPPLCVALPRLGEPCPWGECAGPNRCEQGLCLAPAPGVCGYYEGLPIDLGGEDPVATSGASGESGGETTGVGTGGWGLDCCSPHDVPACDDLDIATCVCLADPTCCTESWSSSCVEAVSQDGCGEC